MKALAERHAEIADRSEERSRSMLASLREMVGELLNEDEQLEPRFEDEIEGGERRREQWTEEERADRPTRAKP